MATGDMHERFGEVQLGGFRVTRMDRHTDTHKQTFSFQYFATLMGEVTSSMH